MSFNWSRCHPLFYDLLINLVITILRLFRIEVNLSFRRSSQAKAANPLSDDEVLLKNQAPHYHYIHFKLETQKCIKYNKFLLYNTCN